MAGIRRPEEDVEPKSQEEINQMPINVIMYGFDSLSRSAFIRKLPKTYSYLTKKLHADVLQGYNIVGDGTPQAIIPVSKNAETFYQTIWLRLENSKLTTRFSNIAITKIVINRLYGARTARDTETHQRISNRRCLSIYL